MKALRLKVRMFGLTTRLFILILQFVCNWVIPDHEAGTESVNNFKKIHLLIHITGVFQWPQDPEVELTVADKLTGFMLDGLVR